MKIRNPRLRLLLGTRWRLIVAALVVVTLVSFVGAGFTYAAPSTETVTQQTHEQEMVTTTTTRAEVVGEDSLWPVGTVLVDKPVYLLNATPTVDVTGRTRAEGASSARIRHEWRLTIRAIRDGESFYSETTTLQRDIHREPAANTTATLDVQAIQQRVVAVQEQVGTAGAVSAHLTLQVGYRTDPGEDHGYTGNETYTAPLNLGANSYVVDLDVDDRTNHSTPATTQVTEPHDWSQLSVLALLGAMSLLLAGAVLSQDPDEIDVERARVDLHRTQYEEWISPGVIPMGISQQFIELESIEDVVDVAIDTSERVVYDRRRDLYAVISENVVYYFSSGGSWMETAFSGARLPGASAGNDADEFDPDVFGGADVGGPGRDAGGADDAGAFGHTVGDDGPFSGTDDDSPFDGNDDGGPFDGADDGPSGEADDGPSGEADDGPFRDGSGEDDSFGGDDGEEGTEDETDGPP